MTKVLDFWELASSEKAGGTHSLSRLHKHLLSEQRMDWAALFLQTGLQTGFWKLRPGWTV